MKKLLFVGMVAIVFTHQASAMMFKRNKKDEFILPIHADNFRDTENTKENNVSDAVTPLITVVKGSDDKPIMVPAKKYIIKKSTTEEGKEILITEMVDAKDDKGNDILMQKTVLHRNAMKIWCDNFKGNSKKPGMWNKDAQIDKIEVTFLGQKVENPYRYKCLDSVIRKSEELENETYGVTLSHLRDMQEKMEDSLCNISWFRWIRNYGQYKRTQEELKRVNDEIISFQKPENRKAFTKSCMERIKHLQDNPRRRSDCD